MGFLVQGSPFFSVAKVEAIKGKALREVLSRVGKIRYKSHEKMGGEPSRAVMGNGRVLIPRQEEPL